MLGIRLGGLWKGVCGGSGVRLKVGSIFRRGWPGGGGWIGECGGGGAGVGAGAGGGFAGSRKAEAGGRGWVGCAFVSAGWGGSWVGARGAGGADARSS